MEFRSQPGRAVSTPILNLFVRSGCSRYCGTLPAPTICTAQRRVAKPIESKFFLPEVFKVIPFLGMGPFVRLTQIYFGLESARVARGRYCTKHSSTPKLNF